MAVITGASRGIGEATAAAMLGAGARGVVITSRKQENIMGAADRLGEPDRVAPLVARSDTEEGAAETVATAVGRFGSCDVLVNNAATNPAYGPLAEVDVGAVKRTWEINLLGPLLYARAVWAGWMVDHGGVICNHRLGRRAGARPGHGGVQHLEGRADLHDPAPGVRAGAHSSGGRGSPGRGPDPPV